MEEATNVVSSIQVALQNTWSTIAGFVPTLISALIIWIIGWFIARSLRWAATKVLKAVQFDDLADRLGINEFLGKGGMKHKASSLIATLIYWIIMFTVLVMVFNTLGLEVVSDLLNKVILFIPNIIVACILLVVGMYLAEFVSGLVAGALKGGNFSSPDMVAKIAYYAVMFLTVTLALNQLNIGDGIIDNIVQIVLGALGIALALAFGLGGRDWAKKQIDNYL